MTVIGTRVFVFGGKTEAPPQKASKNKRLSPRSSSILLAVSFVCPGTDLLHSVGMSPVNAIIQLCPFVFNRIFGFLRKHIITNMMNGNGSLLNVMGRHQVLVQVIEQLLLGATYSFSPGLQLIAT